MHGPLELAYQPMGSLSAVAPWDFLFPVTARLNSIFMGGQPSDRDRALSVYRVHDAEVRAAFTRDRMPVFDVTDGWEPLGRIPDIAVPGRPFSYVNRSAEFKDGHDHASKWE